MLRAHIGLVTDDRKVLNHGAPCQKLTLFDAFRRPLLPSLALRMNTLLRVSASNTKHEFNSLYSHFTLATRSPVLKYYLSVVKIVYLYNVIVDITWTETQIVIFSAMNMYLSR